MSEYKQKPKGFVVKYEVQGRSVGKMRNEITGRQVEPTIEPTFEMATDEAGFHGGEASAPLPLAYFCTGLVACLMTQIRAFSKKMRIDLQDVSINAEIQWEATFEGRNPYKSRPSNFLLDIDLVSSASFEDQQRLIDAAKEGCFIEATLANPIPVNHRLKKDGDYVPID